MFNNPKQEAESLVAQFESIEPIKLSDFSKIYTPTAKLCALYCLDYLLEATEGQLDEEWFEHYNNVKNEIILL